MKRREMIDKIMVQLVKDSPESYKDVSQRNIEMDAIWILNTVESCGMLPPEHPELSFQLKDNGEMTYSVHKWEEK